jgi:hypothetical protein
LVRYLETLSISGTGETMPLTFDFPLEQLKTYQGINPKPVSYTHLTLPTN